jgi:hypothetical protein
MGDTATEEMVIMANLLGGASCGPDYRFPLLYRMPEVKL